MPNFELPLATTTPDSFINLIPFNPDVLRLYSESTSPALTRRLHSRCLRIGNATGLTAWMIGTANDTGASDIARDIAFTNWNLDSDRGYGYKTWGGVIPLVPFQPVTGETFAGGLTHARARAACSFALPAHQTRSVGRLSQ